MTTNTAPSTAMRVAKLFLALIWWRRKPRRERKVDMRVTVLAKFAKNATVRKAPCCRRCLAPWLDWKTGLSGLPTLHSP